MNIKQKLIALLLFIGLVPTLVVSTIAFVAISNSLSTNTANQLQSLSIKQEQRINGLLQKKREEVVKLVNKYDFQVALGQYLATKRQADHDTMAAILQAKKIEVSEIQSISVANLEGVVVASTLAGAEGQIITDKESVTVREDARDGINKLYIATPMSVNKKEAGTVSVIFRIDDIVAAVQDYTGLGSTGETVVVEEDANKNATSLFPLRFDTDAALKKNLTSMQLFGNQGTVYDNIRDYRGQQVMVAARSIGFADWVIATKIDTAEALGPILQLQNTLLAIMVISSIAIIVAALSFARFFTEPILRIARASKLIGTGDFSTQLDIRRKDELGVLAQSINAMGLSLNELVSSIESQRNRLEVILNSTEESILAINSQGIITIANKASAELAGRRKDVIVGKPINEIFSWNRDAQSVSIDYQSHGTTTYRDLQFTDPAGITHYVELIVARIGEGGAEETQAIVTIHDQTKSRELEDMKLDFVSMAAHELRTPLAAIRGYLELISYKGAGGLAGADQYLKQALKSTSELGGLINNLLDVTRIERGTLTVTLERVDLSACLDQAVKEAGFSADDKHITLSYTGFKDEQFVAADPIALREVINNLLTNAIKYTESQGHIDVSLHKKGNLYEVSFKDTGIGIPRQAIPNLFTKFYRVKGGLNSGSTGTGLGLYIAKSMIERHDGTIKVESEEGVGSTFTFTIPALNEKAFAKIQKKQDAEASTRRKHGWTTKNIAR